MREDEVRVFQKHAVAEWIVARKLSAWQSFHVSNSSTADKISQLYSNSKKYVSNIRKFENIDKQIVWPFHSTNPQLASASLSVLFLSKKTDARIVESVNLGAKRCPIFVSSFCHFWGARRNSSIFFVFHRIHRRFLVVPRFFRVYSLSPTPKVAEDRGCALRKPYAEPVWLSLPQGTATGLQNRRVMISWPKKTQLICCTTEPTQLQKPSKFCII